MTIHQLPDPCFVLDPSPWRYSAPHYKTTAKAEAALARERAETDDDDGKELAKLAAARPKALDAPCWVATCDAPGKQEGICGATLGNEDEGPSCVHFDTFEDLVDRMAGESWTRDGADGARCWVHGPHYPDEQSPQPAPTRAEQEAAGQLVIPGVLP